MSGEPCRKPYVRPSGEVLLCTTVAPHYDHWCSWHGVQFRDEHGQPVYSSHKIAQTLLTQIDTGRLDPYLEAILTVAHNRKRAVHGVVGFQRGERREQSRG